jgi:hypothetical protein
VLVRDIIKSADQVGVDIEKAAYEILNIMTKNNPFDESINIFDK